MSDADIKGPAMLESFSVAEVTAYIRELLTLDDQLQDLWITGEISNLTRAASGHWYFTIKDGSAQLKCVMWRSHAERQSITPRNGDAVLVHGAIGVYEAQGTYQLYADLIRPMGIGDLYAQFERLKAKLETEGLFDSERKRPIPPYPRTIGIVTSADAAAFQDVQNVLRRRYPLVNVVLSPCLVQGDNAPADICRALERMAAHADVDVILLVRGGGSIEDLWAFNNEQVARMIVDSRVPVISGVGHETDFTIADFAADLRAPTPSAAAELATPNIEDLRYAVRTLDEHLQRNLSTCLQTRRDDLAIARRSLRHVSPVAQLRSYRQRVDDWHERLLKAERSRIALWNERLTARTAALQAANPNAILARGYAIVYRSDDGQQVASTDQVKPGVGLTIQLHDGELKARVEDKDSHERYKRTLF
jgi:exodeoxyribonuclease VII large subunit